jgi:uncharacterized membrane protein YkoI
MSHFKKTLISAVTVATLALSSHVAIAGMLWNDFNNEQLATIKIDITDAIEKVKKMQTGTVVQAKLEKEDGRLVYGIDLLDNEKEIKVMIDAINGDITVVH